MPRRPARSCCSIPTVSAPVSSTPSPADSPQPATFRPIGVDLRGHGATDKPEPPDPYHYEGMAGDVIAVLDHLGFDDVDIVGGSLGGGVAIHVDRTQPGRARRLVLCEPIALTVSPVIR